MATQLFQVVPVLESPPHAPPGPPEFFNLSFTYRLDSDIVADNYMQYFRPSLWTSKRDFDTLWKTKRNLAAMFSSNCAPPSNRHQYVSLLQKDFPVDIYGACGSKKCPKDREEACNKLIGTYKFYLAFENRYLLHSYCDLRDSKLGVVWPILRKGLALVEDKRFHPIAALSTNISWNWMVLETVLRK